MPMSTTPGFSSETYVGLLFDYLQARGMDAEAVLDCPRPASSPDGLARFPVSRHSQLIERAIAATGDPALALRVGQTVRAEHYGVVGYVVMACPTLAEAIERMQRFERLVNDANRVQLRREAGSMIMEWGAEGFSPGRLYDEFGISALVTFTRQITGVHWHPQRVNFRHADPGYPAVYAETFGCEVCFDQPRTGIVAPVHYLDVRLPGMNAGLRAVLDQQAEQILAKAPDFADIWLRSLHKAVHAALAEGGADLPGTAASLGVSARTLQRRLQAQGLSFQDVLDEVRHRSAEHYLADRRLQLSDVALLLGYSEQSAFNRAFKRWTGRTPRQWREMSKT